MKNILLVLNLFLTFSLVGPLAAQTTTQPTTQPVPPPYSEDQILRTIGRIGWLTDSATILLGLKYLEQIILKMDLSAREDLRKALISVITSDPDTVTTVTAEARKSAGQSLGHTKQVNASAADLLPILKGKHPEPVQQAIIEHTKTLKAMPSADLVTALKDLKMTDTLVEAALGSGDKEIITYLVGLAQAEKRFDFLYGLSGNDAAAIVATHFLDQLNAPAVPTAFVATATTWATAQLDWVDNSTNEEQFLIERSDKADNAYKQIARVAGNQIHYSDTALTPQTLYFYRVKAINLSNSTTTSDTATPSNTVSITTPAAPSTQPVPEPKPPELPSSPPPAVLYLELAKKIAFQIEGKLNPLVIDAAISMLKKGKPEMAVTIGNVITEKFDRVSFDSSAQATAFGLRAITETKARAGVEAGDLGIPPHLRTAYSISLNSNSRALADRFLNTPTPPNPLTILFKLMTLPDSPPEE